MKSKLWNTNFTLLTISNFLMCSAYYSLISTLPVYVSTVLHAPHSIVGLVLSAYAVAAILIRPFTGFGLDYFGRKTIFIASLLVYGLIFNAYILATTVTIMLILRFAHGLTWGLTTTSNTTLAGDIIPAEKRGEGFGLFGVSTTVGMALGPPIGIFILQHSGYNAMFITGFVFSIISMIMAGLIKYPVYQPLPRNRQFKWKNLFEVSTVIPSVNLLIIGLSYGGLISFIALFGKEIGVQNPSGFFLVFALGIITSRFSAGKAVDRNGPRLVILICLSLLIVGYPLLALLRNAWGFYSAALILGFGNGVVWPTFQAMVNNIVPSNRRGAANSTLFIAMDLGMGLGMISAGMISQTYSISTAFLCCSAYCAAGLILFRLFTLKYYLKRRVLVLVGRNKPNVEY
ncbi:MAG: MFS transporter [Bacteroidetes bacterium]|nr:MFS transporter [Bacteroidota bacterium]